MKKEREPHRAKKKKLVKSKFKNQHKSAATKVSFYDRKVDLKRKNNKKLRGKKRTKGKGRNRRKGERYFRVFFLYRSGRRRRRRRRRAPLLSVADTSISRAPRRGANTPSLSREKEKHAKCFPCLSLSASPFLYPSFLLLPPSSKSKRRENLSSSFRTRGSSAPLSSRSCCPQERPKHSHAGPPAAG